MRSGILKRKTNSWLVAVYLKAKKIKNIQVLLEGRKKLAELYGCKRETINNALAYGSQSKQSVYFRQDVLNMFGRVKTYKIVFY